MGTGPLMLDLAGLQVQPDEQDILANPLVGGVILFSRNYQSPDQVQELIAQIRSIRPELIVAVDQEGGRVQRFREGMTALPPLRRLGKMYQLTPDQALRTAHDWGWLMAAEMTSLGVDISFAPVLDVDYGRSGVIGDRAFASEAGAIARLANAYIQGMKLAGMAATGKHFPGHGWVEADSHVDIPVDNRSLEEIRAVDLVPFQSLAKELSGVMPAHVIYASVDPEPAGFSAYWIQEELRTRLGFEGVIFSDDLTMEGARVAGGFPQRAEAAFAAGCDMVLVCNHRAGALEVLEWLETADIAVDEKRFAALRALPQWTWQQLQYEEKWQLLHRNIQGME
ncbi:MAG: beta-N-acetylhexosaminidase [Ketobacteraceae bacterium]|nr:beta-N-acetylhexosaminidase [Ketobacteraceae bacterium]